MKAYLLVLVVIALLCVGACVRRQDEPAVSRVEPAAPVSSREADFVAVGRASYYGSNDGFHGRPTASGERFDRRKLTAAHRTLPFGTRLRVVNIENGRSVEVVVNDRGPAIKDRIIDVSFRAAEMLDFVSAGTAIVRLERLG